MDALMQYISRGSVLGDTALMLRLVQRFDLIRKALL